MRWGIFAGSIFAVQIISLKSLRRINLVAIWKAPIVVATIVLFFSSSLLAQTNTAPSASQYSDLIARSAALSPEQKKQAQGLFATGFTLWKAGNFTAAQLAFKQGLDIDPANGLANYYYGDCLARLSNPFAAGPILLRAIALNGSAPEAFKAQAEFSSLPGAYQSGAYDSRSRELETEASEAATLAERQRLIAMAIDVYTRLIEKAGGTSLAYLDRARLYEKSGDFDRAIADYDSAIASDPSITQYRAQAYEKHGDLAKAAADFESNIEYRKRQYATNSGLGFLLEMAYEDHSRFYDRQKQYDKAIGEINNAINLGDGKINSTLYDRAGFYKDKGDCRHALADLGEYISFKPDDANRYLERSDMYESCGDDESALADASKAISLNSAIKTAAYLKRSVLYQKTRDFKSAVADISSAIALEQGGVEVRSALYMQRASMYEKSGDYAMAIADATQVIAMAPTYLGSAYATRATIYADEGDYEKAIADAQTSVATGKPANHFSLIYVRMKFARDLDAALVDANSDVTNLDPQSSSALWTRAMLELKMAKYADALNDIDAVLLVYAGLNYAYADGYFLRSLIYRKQGDVAHADADLATAKNIDPHSGVYFANMGLTN